MVIITIDGYTMIKRRRPGGRGVEETNGAGSDLGAYPCLAAAGYWARFLGYCLFVFIACIAFLFQIFRGFLLLVKVVHSYLGEAVSHGERGVLLLFDSVLVKLECVNWVCMHPRGENQMVVLLITVPLAPCM